MEKVAKFEKVSRSNYENIIKTIDTDSFKPEYVAYDDILLPVRKTDGSAGYDFAITRDIHLLTGSSVVIPTFLRCFIKPGWDLNLYPRSGLGFKYHMRLANTIGVVDSDYYYTQSDGLDNEGHIMIKIVNEGRTAIKLHKGDRFCQGIFRQFGICFNDEEFEKEVRNGGIGSTGV